MEFLRAISNAMPPWWAWLIVFAPAALVVLTLSLYARQRLRADPSLGADRIVLLSALGDNLLAVLFGVAGVVMAFFGYWAATFMMCTLAWRLMYTARRTTRRITQSI
jgi:hypothetical protein